MDEDPMSKTHRIRSGLLYVALDANNGCLLGENEHYAFLQREHAPILALLDGKRSDDEIAEELATTIGRAETYYHLMQLKAQALIVEKKSQTEQHIEALWHGAGFSPSQVDQLRHSHRFTVKSNIEMLRETVETVLEELGLLACGDDATRNIVIAPCHDYLCPSVERTVMNALAEECLCVPMKLTGKSIWFGPMLSSKGKPCWRCLTDQLLRNRPVETYLLKQGIGRDQIVAAPSDVASWTIMSSAYFGILELAHTLLVPECLALENHVITLNHRPASVQRHRIRTRPQCAQCGDPSLVQERYTRPIFIDGDKHPISKHGGYRVVTASKTFDNNQHLVDPITGIVAKLGTLERRSHVLRPVFGAAYFKHPASNTVTPDESFVHVAYGKGDTFEQARASALCEAVERVTAIYQGDEPVIRGTYASLQPDAVDPRLLQNFSDKQYEDRQPGNELIDKNFVPLPFKEDLEISWTPAWSLTHNRQRLLPTAYCFSHVPVEPKELVCGHNPNGHAAGNCLEEAILQGFLELVERDAVAIWWYNRIKRPKVDIHSFDDPYLVKVQEHYRALGWEPWILNVTHDLGIPCVVSMARNIHNHNYIIGMGCHLDPRIAIQRAVTEMHQVFDPSGKEPPLWNESEIEQPDFLKPSDAIQYASDFQMPEDATLGACIHGCVEKLRQAGLEMLVLDYTRPDVGIATAKVIVPTLRHFWRRVGPGRLYDVPVKLGWLEKPLEEDALNPKSLVV